MQAAGVEIQDLADFPYDYLFFFGGKQGQSFRNRQDRFGGLHMELALIARTSLQ